MCTYSRNAPMHKRTSFFILIMPSYKGTRVHGVSLLATGVVPGTVDIQPRISEVCTHSQCHSQSTHIHMHTFQARRFLLSLDRQKAAIQRLV